MHFKNNTQNRTASVKGLLTVNELNEAMDFIIISIQCRHFAEEYAVLEGVRQVSKKSILSKLPVLLPSKTHAVSLYLRKKHLRLGHAGAQTVWWNVILRFWREIKRIINTCENCFRFSVQLSQQLLGDLPKSRITASWPFQNVGVDYACPFVTEVSQLRKSACLKSYAVILICVVTKAIHIEVFSDLSTTAFIEAAETHPL